MLPTFPSGFLARSFFGPLPFALTLLIGSLASSSFAQEPWAGKDLPVSKGLVLWLDAKVQPDAWQAHQTRGVPLTDGRPLDLWFDGSGHKRHLLQRRTESQPSFHLVDGQAYVGFDGEGDFLGISQSGWKAQELTLFLFAAPQSNAGGFRGLLGASAFGQNDYTSGINLDQSYNLSASFQTVNVEGAGFGGAADLMAEDFPFGGFHLIEVVADADKVRVVLDGKSPGQSRKREKRELALEELVLGARVYSNEAKPAFVQGFFHGGIAEVLLYDRALSEEELGMVRKYLTDKYQTVNQAVLEEDQSGGHLVEAVKDPPPVQMLVPGFEAMKLPVDLPNVNNVLYRPDGKLVALCYNGDIFLLSDTDGDHLEDEAKKFWDNRGRLQAPIGMDLTPPNYKHGQGVFVASKGKCSLIADTDGDDVADKETVIAKGWNALPHGVDALGVAYDPEDGGIYFGLGTENYTNAYLTDAKGKPGYRLDSERGTILRIAPDFQSREIVATGIRFPVAIRFNSEGDLFCTDQEGATWLPNGNPFDELLHIKQGRHYGFPPRHPKFLPDVIDEPSTFDYRPQHQSTCGLNFNVPAANGQSFGPAWWRGEAIVSGYSRGKLYRTQLVKTRAGYVAQSQLLACLNLLTADACVAPDGDLIVAAHSGGPDWGSGPAGQGTLYKIHYQDRGAAQPVLAWSSGEQEVQITFDRPLDVEDLKGLQQTIHIEQSAYTEAGDRFESLRPGYAVVQMQLATKRFDLPVYGVQVTPDQRTVVLSTAKHLQTDHYAVTLPWKSREASKDKPSSLEQHPQIDLCYSLNGVSASLESAEGKTLWEGWLPHLDLSAAKALTQASGPHEAFWKILEAPQGSGGQLTLRTRLDLSEMLRAAVQPGSKLDFKYPPETVTLLLESDQPLKVLSGKARVETETIRNGRHVSRVFVEAPGQDFIPLEITLPMSSSDPAMDLHVAWRTSEDPALRPLPLRRMFVPWANRKASKDQPTQIAALPKELEGGSWGRGRKVFFGEKANCAKCHRVGGEGEQIGPNLSNLIHRDYTSVMRDILQPSFAINPDHLTQTILLTDGRVLTGVVASTGDKLIVADKDGKKMEISPSDVEEMRPSKVSIMPEGMANQLGPDAMRDLLTFLLTAPPSMPRDLDGAPEPRSRVEVEKALAGSKEIKEKRPLSIVLVAGRKDHGPGEHDYPEWQRVWGQLLEAAENVEVTKVMDWPDAKQLASADALVFFQQGTWNKDRAKDLDAFLKRGGGVSYIHYAVDGGQDPDGFADRIGLAWGAGSKFRHGELDLIFDAKHPIARNLSRVHLHDESYWNLRGSPANITLLASGQEENAMQPLVWCKEQDKGRVFVSIPGHYSWTFDDPLFRIVLLRGIAWSAQEPVDRFNDLVPLGASLKEPR